LPLILFV